MTSKIAGTSAGDGEGDSSTPAATKPPGSNPKPKKPPDLSLKGSLLYSEPQPDAKLSIGHENSSPRSASCSAKSNEGGMKLNPVCTPTILKDNLFNTPSSFISMENPLFVMNGSSSAGSVKVMSRLLHLGLLSSGELKGGLKASRWDYLQLLIKENNSDMILLLETHLDNDNSGLCIRKFGSDWSGIHMPGDGRSKGIIMVWKHCFMEVGLIYRCNQTIHVSVSYKNGLPWLFTGIYASTIAKERAILWDFLRNLDISDTPWLLMGDFNCIEDHEDKKGGRNFIQGSSTRGLKELRYDDNSGNLFDRKLEKIGKVLSRWSKNHIGSLEKKLKDTMNELGDLETIDGNELANDVDLTKLKCLTNKVMALNRQLHIKWWTKSRATWIEMNDRNTKYFHSLAKFKKRKSLILELSVDGRCITETQHILNEFVSWYKNLWKLDANPHANWDELKSLDWKKLPNSRHNVLFNNISEKEIELAMNSLGRGKALDPDGFSLEFFLISFWNTIKESYMKTVHSFCTENKLPVSWGSTNLVFIPK
ncbi:hypothetical protein Cni_G19952 [Canna indica]|uniref:Endonuclease/exonuclease/phosphatase domain-containing protein n=1 Tax=Canna indica TaxID=4628 RepID=A0AAQ3QK93_9LILI|nr:hypothetical protein Cni_G19952 [Canna indica]